MTLTIDNFYLTQLGEVVQLTGYNANGLLALRNVHGSRINTIYTSVEALLCQLVARWSNGKIQLGLYITSSNFHGLGEKITVVHKTSDKEIDVQVLDRTYNADINLYTMFVVPL